ncbi:MAG: hypothetical protein GY722_29445 [bacterium]|nr:hypothetical protein [bacterium]
MATNFAVFGVEVQLDADHLQGLLDAQDPLVQLSASMRPRLSDAHADPYAPLPAGFGWVAYPNKVRKRPLFRHAF